MPSLLMELFEEYEFESFLFGSIVPDFLKKL